MEYSKNKKTNETMKDIETQLFDMGETKTEALQEIKRYKKEFPKELDYNIVQYGNLLVYYYDIRKFFERNGYKGIDKLSDSAIWEKYKKFVRIVVNKLLKD
jgi:hypothetical protein